MTEISYAANDGSGSGNARGQRGVASLEVDPVTDELVFHAAHFLGMDKKEFVAEAVRVYMDQRREEVRHGMVESMRLLDGALGASVTMVAGQPPAQVEDPAAPAPAAEPIPQAPAPAEAMMHPDHNIQNGHMMHPEHNGQAAQFRQG